MKKWKRFVVVVLAMVLTLAFSGMTVAAESAPDKGSVYDQADLLSYDEEMELASQITELQSRMDMGLAIVTSDENSGSGYPHWKELYHRGWKCGRKRHP